MESLVTSVTLHWPCEQTAAPSTNTLRQLKTEAQLNLRAFVFFILLMGTKKKTKKQKKGIISVLKKRERDQS